MTTEDHLGAVPCDGSANEWRKCVERNLGDKAVATKCESSKQMFDTCVDKWREVVGPSAKVKGTNEGDPPEQCAAMSCLVGECLRTYNYEFARCKPPMDFFKHCVKKFYGSEYITE